MTQLDTNTFLAMLHGKDAAVFFQVGSKTWKNKPQTFRQAEQKLRWRNAEGEGICFIVNSGGTKDAQIVRFNAVFLDWDCGRDPDKRYWPLEHVRAEKDRFIAILGGFSPAPSIVVETRNGYHAYWLLKDNVTASQFRDCQLRLAQFFGSDPMISNPARAMRLPGFNWIKPGSGCDPFPVRVVTSNDVRYRLEQIVDHLPVVATEVATAIDDESAGTIDGVGLCAHNKCESSPTLALTVGAYPAKETPLQSPVIFSSIPEAIDYLKFQDISQYLGIGSDPGGSQGKTISCPFHADNNPSGSVFRHPRTGHWFFKCHSSLCGVTGTIIDMAMRLRQLPDEKAALKHLFDQYHIQIETGWKTIQESILTANIAILNDAVALKAQYPNLFKLVGRIRGDLISKLSWFRDHVVSERNRVGDEAVFFASLRQFHKLSAKLDEQPRYFNRQNEKVDRYCLLGLLRKIADEQLPEPLLIEARRRQKESRHAHRIQWYSVPAYTGEVLNRADERARVLIDAGASVRGVSLELIADLFGPEMAAEVYPQRRTEQHDAGKFQTRLTAILLAQLDDAGFATIKAIRLALRSETEWKSVTERRIEKALPGIIKRYRFRKLTCNAALKSSLGIACSGFPKVIVREEPLSPATADISCLQSES